MYAYDYDYEVEQVAIFDPTQEVGTFWTCSKCQKDVPVSEMPMVPTGSLYGLLSFLGRIPREIAAEMLLEGIGQIGDTCKECAAS
ncbi:hypothetical protein G352_10322 [Rhodococcus ruber BKS 20-38]|uniref:Uncharacterized protein n=1 Tax=Rhodococcus ruber BKS 20-38 TaxID=1278076 RepID=M2ZYG7_9NOCA|nr:hypothetical protein [Rhodococcus ruber]EME65374.1 hypothetical protein G352_10322 [Rhodococcus ruber BKS 20-38]